MSAFDDLTLADVDELSTVVLAGKSISDPASDPLKVAGGVLWLTRRRNQPDLTWADFSASTTMGEIKEFSKANGDAADPTVGPPRPTTN